MTFSFQRGFHALTSCLLLLLFGCVAFLQACHDLQDNDVWWHLRAGEWILQHGAVPDRDPFTFASADQRWIDLHWLFQIVLALAFRAGGIPAIILFSAAIASAAVLLALVARPSSAPLPAALLGWLPCLLLAADRFLVRPEMVTLLFLAAYLAVLLRLDDQPRLAWILPLLQVVWVNIHGLFILGPILLALRLVEQAGRDALHRKAHGQAERRRWWSHVGAAGAATVLACLCNPYGPEGALFPFVLLPKVTVAGNPYKAYIQEFRTPREFVAAVSPQVAGDKGCFCCFYFVLLLLPVSFLLPALWRSTRLSSDRDKEASPGVPAAAWVGLLAASAVLLAARALTLSLDGRPEWLLLVAQSVPAVLALGGAGGAALLARRSRSAALLAASGGPGLACWTAWLEAFLAGGTSSASSPSSALLLLALAGMSIAAGLILYSGGSGFRLGLAVAFAYLALNATNSLSRLGLVTGVLLSAELAPWLGSLAEEMAPRSRAWAEAGVRLGLGSLLAGWIWAISTGWQGSWLSAAPLGLGEQPLTFAHDAARFAGQPDMPRRALVFDLVQACVYVYHSSPEHQAFMDARLEVPTLATFQHYVALEKKLQKGDLRVFSDIRELGDPVLLLPHEGFARAEAALLRRTDWQLVYFDALAAVFLPSSSSQPQTRFARLDLASRHFHAPQAPSQPAEPGAALLEGQAFVNLAAALPDSPASERQLRVAVLLSALDRAELARKEEASPVEAWMLLGACHAGLAPPRPGPSPAGGWDPPRQLAAAQAVYCFQQARAVAPGDPRTLQALSRLFAAWGMKDVQEELGSLPDLPSSLPGDPAGELQRLLNGRQLLAAVHLTELAVRDGQASWSWPLGDRLAGVCLSVGRPALARQLWQSARNPPSEAVRHCRLGDTFWVEQDLESAARHYQRARRLDSRLGLPCWALAWLLAQQGQADAALDACQAGLARTRSSSQRGELEMLATLLQNHVR